MRQTANRDGLDDLLGDCSRNLGIEVVLGQNLSSAGTNRQNLVSMRTAQSCAGVLQLMAERQPHLSPCWRSN